MHSSDKNKLLKEVLAESDYPQFREQLHRRATREYRQFHRKTSGRFWLALAASLTFIALLFQQFTSRRTNSVQSQVEPPLAVASAPQLINSPSTKSVEVIRTRPISDSLVIRTVPNISLLVTSRPGSPQISDVQLLALLRSHSSGYVEVHGEKQFVIFPARNRAN